MEVTGSIYPEQCLMVSEAEEVMWARDVRLKNLINKRKDAGKPVLDLAIQSACHELRHRFVINCNGKK